MSAPAGFYPQQTSVQSQYAQQTQAAQQTPAAAVEACVVEDPQVKLEKYVKAYNITPPYQNYLGRAAYYNFAFFVDDSGSMGDPLFPGGPVKWGELKTMMHICIGAATIYDADGIDLYFMNRRVKTNEGLVMGMKGVKTEQLLTPHFDLPPGGTTPLVKGLKNLFAMIKEDLKALQKQSDSSEVAEIKPVRLIIPTDGVPDEGFGKLIELFTEREDDELLKEYLTITFVMVTSDENLVKRFRKELDKQFTGIDLVDDYNTEAARVKKNTPDEQFTFGNYIVKALVGAVIPKLDKLGESLSQLKVE